MPKQNHSYGRLCTPSMSANRSSISDLYKPKSNRYQAANQHQYLNRLNSSALYGLTPRYRSLMMSATTKDASQSAAGAIAMDEEQMRKNIMEKLQKMKEAVECGDECEDPEEIKLRDQF